VQQVLEWAVEATFLFLVIFVLVFGVLFADSASDGFSGKRILSRVPQALLASIFYFVFLLLFSYLFGLGESSFFYVSDEANVIDEADEKLITANGEVLFDDYVAQIVVATVDSTDGVPPERYAMELFNTWGLGDKEYNNGFLILLVINDDTYWATPGDGLRTALPDEKIYDILHQSLEPDFAAKRYSAGAVNVYRAFYESLGGIWKPERAEVHVFHESDIGTMGVAVFLLLLWALCVIPSTRRRYRAYYGVPFDPFSDWNVKTYGKEGYWGAFGGPQPGFHAEPMPKESSNGHGGNHRYRSHGHHSGGHSGGGHSGGGGAGR
jgi:uncharacterized membrane protein YgcG